MAEKKLLSVDSTLIRRAALAFFDGEMTPEEFRNDLMDRLRTADSGSLTEIGLALTRMPLRG